MYCDFAELKTWMGHLVVKFPFSILFVNNNKAQKCIEGKNDWQMKPFRSP